MYYYYYYCYHHQVFKLANAQREVPLESVIVQVVELNTLIPPQ